MAELTRKDIIARVKSGDSLEREDLSKLDLSQADLRKAKLLEADLTGAKYTQVQLEDSVNVDQAIL